MQSPESSSRIGLGCASAWGQSWFDHNKAIAIVRRAIDLGVSVFDTGPSYSAGHAEPRLGKALRGVDTERLLISSKVGTHIGKQGRLFHDLTRPAVLRSVENSRKRLGLPTIPLLYLHGPKLSELNNELFDTLNEVRNKGWVLRFGVNSFETEVLQALISLPLFDTVMLDYNILRISREPLIHGLASSGKTVVAGSALANHMHAPRFAFPRSKSDVWYLLRAFKNYRREYIRGRRLAFLKKVEGWTPAQLALAFVLSNPKVRTAMFSTTHIEHLEQNLAARSMRLPASIEKQIRETA